MSAREKRITVFWKDGSQEKIVIKPGTKGLSERERLNSMTEEEVDRQRRAEGDRNARSDPDALPVEDEEMWKRGKWVDPEPSTEPVLPQ